MSGLIHIIGGPEMGGSPSSPTPPDPAKTAAAQGDMNIGYAIAQQQLNNVSQVTPYGNIIYKQTGVEKGPGGWNIPTSTAYTTLSPEMQKLFNSNLQNSTQTSYLENNLLNNAAAGVRKPLDLSYGATEANLNRLGRNTLDPQFAQQQLQLNQTLANQGLTPGSEGWNYAQKAFGMNKADAYNDLYLRGHQSAVSDITNQYNSPINTLSALRSNTQISQPGIGSLAPTAQSQINPPNYEGDVYASANLAQQNASRAAQSQQSMLGGLFGLGGQLIGGLGGLMSDRETKTDITPLGKEPESGLDMYAYRYKDDPKSYPKVVGPMAQDVEKQIPGSTKKIGGHMVIKPGFGIGG